MIWLDKINREQSTCQNKKHKKINGIGVILLNLRIDSQKYGFNTVIQGYKVSARRSRPNLG